MNSQMKLNRTEKIFFFFFSALIFLFSIWNIRSAYSPLIVPDEVGYWASAAYFAGQDWSGVMQLAPYYSYGYGFLLTPLYLIKNPIWRFRGAVCINVILLIGIFGLLFRIGRRLIPNVKRVYLLCSCFVISLYSAYIFYVQLTFVEITLTFFFLLAYDLFLSLEERPRLWKAVFLGVCVIFLYVIHQRSLGIIIAFGIAIIILLFSKQVNWKIGSVIIVSAIVALALSSLCKSTIIQDVYANASNVGKNDFTGQVSKLSYMFSMEGIFSLVVNFLGRFFYLGCSTFFLFYWGMICLVKDVADGIKQIIKKENCRYTVSRIFLLLSVLAAVGISAISTIEPARIDTLLYGRYSEYVIAPVLLYGIYGVSRWKKFSWTSIGLIAFHLCSAMILYYYIGRYGIAACSENSIVGIVQFPKIPGVSSAVKYTISVGVISTLLGGGITFLLRHKRGFKIIAVGIVGSLWLGFSYFNIVSLINSQKDFVLDLYKLAERVMEYVDEENIYYLLDDTSSGAMYWNIYRYKYIMSDLNIVALDYHELDKVDDAEYILLHTGAEMREEIMQDYVILDKTDDTYFLTCKDNKEAIEQWKSNGPIRYEIGLENAVSANNISEEASEMQSNGIEGYLFRNVVEEIYQGKYEVNADIEILEGVKSQLAVFSIYVDGNIYPLYEKVLEWDDFENGYLHLEIPLELSSGCSIVEFRCFTETGTVLKVSSLSYQYLENEYRDGIDRMHEVKQVVNDIVLLHADSPILFVGVEDEALCSMEYWKEGLGSNELKYKVYSDFIGETPGSEIYIIKRTKELFEYSELLKTMTLLDATPSYFLAVSNNNMAIINAWQSAGYSFASKEDSFSVRCLTNKEESYGLQLLNFSTIGCVDITMDISAVKSREDALATIHVSALEDITMRVFENAGVDRVLNITKKITMITPEEKLNIKIKMMPSNGLDLNVEDVWIAENHYGAYLQKLYSEVLGRQADLNGIKHWYQYWQENRVSAAEMLRQFMDSDEAKARNLSDEQFLSMLYQVCWNQDIEDQGDIKEEIEALGSGVSREQLVQQFLESPKYEAMLKSENLN
ncbi:DUF4214 domain-containing protein [Cuneatibacter sp. NSJ-177]|uniref:DUF4214 domain-containing protein n=1 Tax=Cuneatibacter sp. NSJ-177 TaxID=2931401 RepID=UPI001FD3BA75|nr:DUF4214 domain-containing protein [Cuneatibacter sp. NSJ-177]MCJ7836926.1 DUF4214 domain-containing protein [Cuneatibacter sp. NSJ-177]